MAFGVCPTSVLIAPVMIVQEILTGLQLEVEHRLTILDGHELKITHKLMLEDPKQIVLARGLSSYYTPKAGVGGNPLLALSGGPFLHR